MAAAGAAADAAGAGDDINIMPFTTLLSWQIAEWSRHKIYVIKTL